MAGQYTVTLTVTDPEDADNTDTTSAIITVGSGQQTTPVLVVNPSTVRVGDAVSFDASNSIPADGQTLTSYTFDFGDGTTETRRVADFGADAARTSHVYAAAGDYTPSVTVSDSAQASRTATASLKVRPTSGGGNPPTTPPTGGGSDDAPAPPPPPAAAGGSGALGSGLLLALGLLGLRRRRG